MGGFRIGVGYQFMGPSDRCAYCGATPEAVDHTVPQHYRNENWRLGLLFEFTAVATCMDCNIRAGSTLDVTFKQRKRRICESLSRASRRLVSVPEWGQDELAELGDGIRPYIEAADAAARETKKRLANLRNPWWPHPKVRNRLWPNELLAVAALDGAEESAATTKPLAGLP